AAIMIPAAAAQAHDVLEATTPSDGSTVGTVPEQITMTFNNTPTAIGSEILIKDSAGTNWANGPVDIVDHVVTQGIKPGAAAGKYTVQWRIVSSDSHPIEGTFSFTANGTGTKVAGPAQTPTAAGTATDTSSAALPWGGIIAGVIVVLAIITGLAMVRRQLKSTEKRDSQDL
ncbi:copper resistance protein CopC, partial [Arthrobacter livingstonensis]